MSATWTSQLPDYKAREERAQQAALIASAKVLERALKEEFAKPYYVTGEFSTGKVRRSIRRTQPYVIEPGKWGIRVGTNVFYARFWELGFVPAPGVFSPGMGTGVQGPVMVRRVEKVRPATVASRVQVAKAYSEAYVRALGAKVTASAPIQRAA